MIRAGDQVAIRPEWQDPGDEHVKWVALEDEDGGRVRIQATNLELRFPPNQVVETFMVDLVKEENHG